MHPTRALISLALILAAAPACTQFPELDGTIPPALADASAPALIPLAPVLALADGPATAPPDIAAALDERIANLNARAARLRGPVIPAATRTRMLRGVR